MEKSNEHTVCWAGCLSETFTTTYPVLFLNPDALSCAAELTIVSQHMEVTGCKPGWLWAGWEVWCQTGTTRSLKVLAKASGKDWDLKTSCFQNLSPAAGKIPTVSIPVATSTPLSWGGGRQWVNCAVHVCVSAVWVYKLLSVFFVPVCVWICVCTFWTDAQLCCSWIWGSRSHSSLTGGWGEPEPHLSWLPLSVHNMQKTRWVPRGLTPSTPLLHMYNVFNLK